MTEVGARTGPGAFPEGPDPDAAGDPGLDLAAVWPHAGKLLPLPRFLLEGGEAGWDDVLAGLGSAGSEISSRDRAFLGLTRPLGVVGGTALLAAPNDFTKDLLESRFRPLVTAALSRALGGDVRVAVTVEAPPEDSEQARAALAERQAELHSHDAGAPAAAAAAAALSAPRPLREPTPGQVTEPARLNAKYTFDTFVIGSSNRFAHAAAVAVAEAPAKAYNPLFIYGDSGLGKTHLLHAIGHYAQHLFPGLRVRYVSSEEFTNDFINSIRDDKKQAFQRRYRDMDVLLVDDIQFLENKVQTQEEFFHVFNTLHNNSKQIVITSDRHPKQLSTLEDRLRNRFEWGLLTDVTPPELETRIAILRRKAAQESLTAPDDVLEFIASKVERNIRELEGALIRVTAFASLNRSPVDLRLAEVVLKDLIGGPGGTEVTSAIIMAVTAEYFSISLDDLCGTSRSRVLVTARQIAMYLCRELTDLSLPKIGQNFGGKDHTTVMHAVKKVSGLMAERRALYNQVTELTNRVKTRARQS